MHDSLIEMIYHALRRQRCCLAQLIFLNEILHVCWVEQNLCARQRSHFRFPLEHVIQSSILQLEALHTLT